MRLTNRVAVITGGGRGIGAAAARVFAQEGARVVIGDLLAAEGEATVTAIRQAGGEAEFLRTDVSREADCQALMAKAVALYGRLDVLLCCAGILRGAFVPVEEFDEAVFASVLDVNVKGTFLCAKHAVPSMRQGGGGVILLIASGAGVRGPSSSVAYGASKGGAHGFAMTLEAKLAPLGIRVNDVCPGVIDTDMMRGVISESARMAGRSADEALANTAFGDPLGLARVLAFLASPDADFVRGTIFTR
jgi:NAD(P)-dependent dehydrogenase (short-subunit alcohol dehydrogenase family)